MQVSNVYLRLSGKYADSFRLRLKLNLLPIVSPLPETLDGGEYGQLKTLKIDAARLTGDQVTALIDWIWRKGDDPDRAKVEADVLENKASYLLREGDESEIIQHDPAAWG